MSQLSAEAEGRAQLNQSMMEGSRTGKAAEADLMILIGKSPTVGVRKKTALRHINIVKNKLNGWHGMVNCELDYQQRGMKDEDNTRRREHRHKA